MMNKLMMATAAFAVMTTGAMAQVLGAISHHSGNANLLSRGTIHLDSVVEYDGYRYDIVEEELALSNGYYLYSATNLGRATLNERGGHFEGENGHIRIQRLTSEVVNANPSDDRLRTIIRVLQQEIDLGYDSINRQVVIDAARRALGE